MRYFPIQLDVSGQPALVVGAEGEVVGKIERLLEAGAKVRVVAEGAVEPRVAELAEAGALALERRPFEDGDLAGARVVFVATGEEETGRRLIDAARAAGALLCTVDRPELSTFVNPAVASVAGLDLTIGTSGASPALARRLREDLESVFSDPRFARFLAALGALRARLPRGERAERARRAVEGFALRAELVFPAWLDRGEDPP